MSELAAGEAWSTRPSCRHAAIVAVSAVLILLLVFEGRIDVSGGKRRQVVASSIPCAVQQGAPLDDGKPIPEPDTPGGIPRVVHVTWKSLELPETARAYHEEWLAKEPNYTRRITTDAGCRRLAGYYVGLQPHYDRLPLNVMRADVCRLLLVYFHGGLYMDMDIRRVKPLDEWVDLSGDKMLLGFEQMVIVTNWFFGARKHDPCLKSIIDYVISKIAVPELKIESRGAGDTVMLSTGPWAFSFAVAKCEPMQPIRYTAEQMNDAYILHDAASRAWHGAKAYDSWVDQRRALAIERAINIVWRTDVLPAPLEPTVSALRLKFHANGFADGYRLAVHSDHDCRDHYILNRMPKLLPLYDRLPLNVMRAHLCKLVVLHLDGGVYMDADVSPGTQPMSQWLDVHGGLLLGWEEEGTVVADWFAAVPAQNVVVKCMLAEYTDRLNRADLTVKSEEDVDRLTGRAAFTKAALGCNASIRLSAARMKSGELLVHAAAAAGAWTHHERGAREYRSWRREARAAAIPKTLTYVWWPGAGKLPMANPNQFAKMEPSWAQRRLGAAECRKLAREALGGEALLSAFDRLTSDRARARLCGVMAVHRGGGLYLDSDAAYKEHITAWLNVRPESGVVLAETEGPAAGGGANATSTRGIAPWVFAATPGHACMAAVRDAIVARVVHGTTGDGAASPVVFAEGAARCGAMPTLELNDVTETFLKFSAG